MKIESKEINLVEEIESKEVNLVEEIKSEYDLARLCEVAFIQGKLEGKGEIEEQDKDLEEMYNDIYKPIFTNFMYPQEDTFETEEEEGYISAYAERIIKNINNQMNGGN